MTFLHPTALWLLAIPLALLLLGLRSRQAAAADTHPKILRAETKTTTIRLTSSTPTRYSLPATRYFMIAALAAAIIALARPQYGTTEQPVYDQSREILIAVDLSRSMLADDVKPTRLDRARLLITSLLEKLKGERVGLLVFSGTAFLQSPLSADYEILNEFLPLLSPDLLPEGGTNYDALLAETLAAFNNSNTADRFLIILSDGEAHTDDWRAHIEKLRARNIRVLALGIGTPDGAMIQQPDGTLLKDHRGAVVLTKLQPDTLRALATATDGEYRDASTWIDLSQLINDTVEKARRGEFLETTKLTKTDRYQYPLALALLLALLSFAREFPTTPKPRKLKLTTTTNALLSLILFSTVGAELARAQNATTTPAPQNPPGAAAPPTSSQSPTSPSDHLRQTITTASAHPALTPADCEQIAQNTLAYADTEKETAAQQKQHPVIPEPIIRDAIAATHHGEKIDPKNQTTDWPRLREKLEDLLKPPPRQDDQQQDKNDQQNQDNQSQDNQSQQNQSGGGQSDSKNQNPDQNQNDKQQNQSDQSDSQSQNSQQNKPDQQQNQDPSKTKDQQQNDSSQSQQNKQQDQQSKNQQQPKSDPASENDPGNEGPPPRNDPKETPDQPKDQKPDQQKSDTGKEPDKQPPQQQPRPKQQDAFGKMEKPEPQAKPQNSDVRASLDDARAHQQPPQARPDLQQVGGTPIPIATDAQQQKLDQLRQNDSPAILFQRIQSGEQPAANATITLPQQNW